MPKKFVFVSCLSVLLISIGCAPEVRRVSSTFIPMSPGRHIESFYLTDDVIIKLHTGYESILKHESRWNFVGQIPEGNVYKPHDQVLTVEGANIHEAYIVISNGQLVGFYLPVEKAFSPLLLKLPLPIK